MTTIGLRCRMFNVLRLTSLSIRYKLRVLILWTWIWHFSTTRVFVGFTTQSVLSLTIMITVNTSLSLQSLSCLLERDLRIGQIIVVGGVDEGIRRAADVSRRGRPLRLARHITDSAHQRQQWSLKFSRNTFSFVFHVLNDGDDDSFHSSVHVSSQHSCHWR